MLKLCGFAASNYHNKVKLALLEKQLPFEEVLVWPGQADLAASPMGKLPYLLTEHGPMSESTVILEYLEQRYPEVPLLPADAYQAAKVRELVRYMELHLELVARNVYPEAFFGGKVSDSLKAKVAAQLEQAVTAFVRLARPGPFLAGQALTLADCAAAVHLPLVSSACKLVYGRDLLAPLGLGDYLAQLGARESVQQINAERKRNTELMLARMAGKQPAA